MLTLISIIIASVAGMFVLTRQLHMLQQNSYFNSRYLSWAKENFGFKTIFSFFLFVISCSFIKIDWLVLSIVCVLALIKIMHTFSFQKKAIKPLVFTARIKRMYVTAAIVFVALCVCAFFFENIASYLLIAVLALFYFPGVVAVSVNLINAPIENLVKLWYICDAKKKLRSLDKMKIIGITGSYGKTSTKHILARILNEKYNVCFTPGSFNTPMGVVRTIREYMKPQTEIFVCEMGAKNVGDIDEICRIVKPDIAMITSVGPQHLNTFKSIENIVKTKFELADSVKKKGGKVYLSIDNNYINEKSGEYDSVTYGTNSGSGYRAENITCGPTGTKFDVVYNDKRISLSTKLLGMHNVINITGAVAIALELGVSERDIIFAVSKLEQTEHRLQLKPFIKGATLIDDAYNANPEGCMEAVRVLGSFDGMKKVIVTPGLVELGEREYQCNYDLGLQCTKYCDEIILVGKERSKPMTDAIATTDFDKYHVHVVASFKDAVSIMQNMLDANYAVLFENDLPDNYAK